MGKDNQFDLMLRQTRRLRVGACDVDLALNEISGEDGRVARLTPKAAGVLEVLLYTAGQPVSRERLLAEVWRGEFPTDDVVTHAIGELRRAFGDDTRAPRYVRTLARVGYALVAEVGPLEDSDALADQRLAAALASVERASTAAPAAHPRGRRRWALAASLVLGLVAVVLATLALVRPAAEPVAMPAPASGLADARMRVSPATSLPGNEMFPSLSPDASLLAFSAAPGGADPMGRGMRIHVQVPGGDNSRQLSQQPADSEFYPVFSPDGRELVFQRITGDQCRLVIAGVMGDAERSVGNCSVRLVAHVAWTPDGSGLLMPVLAEGSMQRAVLHRLDLASGAMSPLDYPSDPASSDVQGKYSPDGGRIAFRRGPLPHSDLFVMDADGSELRRITTLRAQMPGFDWTPDGQSLVFASDHGGIVALYRVALADGTIEPLGIERAWWPDVAALRDEVVFVREAASMEVAELGIDGAPDPVPRRLAPTSRSNASAVYSPDGHRVALVSDRSGESALYLVEDGSTRRLAEHPDASIVEPRWSADGREILYVVRGGGARLYAVEVDSGRVRELTPAGHMVMSAAFSPDGRGIAFTSNHSGRWELWWMGRSGDAAPHQLTATGARHPEFRDARRLVFVGGAEIGALHQLDLDSGAVTDLGHPVGFWNQRAWHVAEDGLYVLRSLSETGIYRRDWNGGQWQLVEPLGAVMLGEFRMSLDLAGSRALVTVTPDDQGDIYRATDF